MVDQRNNQQYYFYVVGSVVVVGQRLTPRLLRREGMDLGGGVSDLI